MLNQSTHTNVSQSKLTNMRVGHDQRSFHHTNFITINHSSLTTEPVGNGNWKRPSPSEVSPPKQSLIPSDSESRHNVPTRAVTTVVDPVDKILLLPADRVESSESVQCQESKQVLVSLLEKTLISTRLAIQTDECTHSGPSLRNNIDPEMRICCVVLPQDILDKINRRQKGLDSMTHISYLLKSYVYVIIVH
jgi:hypothetical protein